MKTILLQTLMINLSWNKSRIKCLAGIIIALIESCSVCTKSLAIGIEGKAKLSSKIQRVYRLFRDQAFDYEQIAQLIADIFISDKYILALDRTCWKFGKHDINILFLAIVIGKISVPLYWHLLDHGGTCDNQLMQNIMSKFIDKFGVDKIKYLLADREFMNKKWLKFLIERKIKFAIPLRKDMKVRISGNAQDRAAGYSFNALCTSEYNKVQANLWDYQVRLAAYRNSKSELMVIASNTDIDTEIFALYRCRWAIERLFKHLKTSGFNIEKSHITINDRFAKLVAICSICSALIIKSGLILSCIIPIKIKKFKGIDKQLYSLFSYGIDHLKLYLKRSKLKIAKYFKFLFNPLKSSTLFSPQLKL